MSRNAISPTREQDFAKWYQQVIVEADLAEHAPVRGCMVLKPYGYAIWENIQQLFDKRLKKIGVQNAYFPLLIPLEFLSKEAEHIEGFAKECAVVTHHRLKKDENGNLIPDGKLTTPYIIRPTSEAIIGNIVSKWIHTYRDLPLKLNQWCNVMRWEMRTRLFLRTSEFLWQEGHTIFETEKEAQEDALKMLDHYYDLVEHDLALPAIKGKKTEGEKFPGAVDTYTLEIIMQDGKALQGCTSHYLGHTFSKAFDISYLGRDNKEHIAYTSSWGLSTRIIGGIIMSHADDDGLVLPPSIAPFQVVIIPILNKENNQELYDYGAKLKDTLEELSIRTHIDITEYSNSQKIWNWIKKGAPIRIEIGIKEFQNKCVTLIRRDLGKDGKIQLHENALHEIPAILNSMADGLRNKARILSDQKIKPIHSLQDLEELFAQDFKGLALINLDETNKPEFATIAERFALSLRCIPETYRDIAQQKVLIGKSY